MKGGTHQGFPRLVRPLQFLLFYEQHFLHFLSECSHLGIDSVYFTSRTAHRVNMRVGRWDADIR